MLAGSLLALRAEERLSQLSDADAQTALDDAKKALEYWKGRGGRGGSLYIYIYIKKKKQLYRVLVFFCFCFVFGVFFFGVCASIDWFVHFVVFCSVF